MGAVGPATSAYPPALSAPPPAAIGKYTTTSLKCGVADGTEQIDALLKKVPGALDTAAEGAKGFMEEPGRQLLRPKIILIFDGQSLTLVIMVIAIILILFAVALFLVLRNDHDDSYTRSEPRSGRENGRQSVYQKSAEPKRSAPAAPKPAPFMAPRTTAPEPKQYPSRKPDERFKPGDPEPKYASNPSRPAGREAHAPAFAYGSAKAPDFSYLDGIDYDPTLPERTMSSFIAGLQGYCTQDSLGGVVGYVTADPVTGALEVHAADDALMGYLPMKDRAAFQAFNPDRIPCPFAGHIGLSVTGRYYADIRIVLPSSRPFVEDSLRGFLG